MSQGTGRHYVLELRKQALEVLFQIKLEGAHQRGLREEAMELVRQLAWGPPESRGTPGTVFQSEAFPGTRLLIPVARENRLYQPAEGRRR